MRQTYVFRADIVEYFPLTLPIQYFIDEVLGVCAKMDFFPCVCDIIAHIKWFFRFSPYISLVGFEVFLRFDHGRYKWLQICGEFLSLVQVHANRGFPFGAHRVFDAEFFPSLRAILSR